MNLRFWKSKVLPTPLESPRTSHSTSEVVDDIRDSSAHEDLLEADRLAIDLSAHVGREFVWKSIRLAPIFIGMLFLMISLILEHPNLLGGFETPERTGQGFSSVVFTTKTAVLLVAEIGYAFIVAGVVANFLELNAKREIVELFRIYQSQIKRAAFEAVYRIKHSDEYVRAVIGNCFESPLIREDYRITYELDSLSPDIVKAANVPAGQFVMVTATVLYKARNVGPDRQKFPTGYGIPFQPGPLEKYARMDKLQVGRKIYSEEEIRGLEVKSTGVDMTSEKTYNFDVPTDPNSFTDVIIEITLIKEISDNDAFGFRRPTVGASIQLINRMEKVLRFGVTPRTSARLRETRPPSLRSGEWRIDGPILPFDSVILWWGPRSVSLAQEGEPT